ncbi:MAG: cytochrome c [Vicinamibacterales bacterium]
MRRHMKHPLTAIACVAMTALLVVTAAAPVAAQRRGRRKAAPMAQPKPGVFSEAQAARGEALYADNCSYCHLFDLSGGDLAPALTGPPFVAKWAGKPLSEVFDYMRVQMPLNSPGGLSAQQNADVLAFLLKRAGFPAGAIDLPLQSAGLKGIVASRP